MQKEIAQKRPKMQWENICSCFPLNFTISRGDSRSPGIYHRRGPCLQQFPNPLPGAVFCCWGRKLEAHCQNSRWLVWNLWRCFASLCFPFWRWVHAVKLGWLFSPREELLPPQGVISLLVLPCDLPGHIDLHLPFYFSPPANSLVPPGFVLFRNVSSWDPGNIFVFSFLSHWPFSLVVGPFE